MRREWTLKLLGGAYDGWRGVTEVDPQPVLVVWKCSPVCGGHAAFDPHEPAIVLRTAESYRLTSSDPDTRVAVYEIGEHSPGLRDEERELVGSGAGPAVA